MENLLFTAEVSPSKLFFRSLMVMKSMTDSPSCFFMNGNIKLRAHKNDAIAILVMDSWAWSSDPSFYSTGFAVRCDSCDWLSRLPPSLFQQEDRPLYFCVKRGSRNVYGLAELEEAKPCDSNRDRTPGEDLAFSKSFVCSCIPPNREILRLLVNSRTVFLTVLRVEVDSRMESFEFCLGELFRLRPHSDSIDLDLRDVSLYLRSECLREVITSFASRRESVMMLIYEKSVAWVTQVGVLRYHEERNERRVEGVDSGSIHYTHVEWKGKDALLMATEISEMVLIYAMADPRCRDWISFKFIVDRDNYLRYVMRGLANQLEF